MPLGLHAHRDLDPPILGLGGVWHLEQQCRWPLEGGAGGGRTGHRAAPGLRLQAQDPSLEAATPPRACVQVSPEAQGPQGFGAPEPPA